ncbi:MAG: radical SAM protein [Bacteroidetes bacterium]|nr:radical SAM protein [Bacteroidota bacterium]
MNQKILLISPPFVQMNTPYPATCYLKGFLNTIGIESNQCDLGLEVILALFSKSGLQKLFSSIENLEIELSENASRMFALRSDYLQTIDAVIGFLQNSNPSLAHRICTRHYLPEAKRFEQAKDIDWAFGVMGTHDMARHLATLYLEDISDLIVETVDPYFGFSRYAEHISAAASSFDELYENLHEPATFVDGILLHLLEEKIKRYEPSCIGFSVPFPGSLYSALRCGQWIKTHHSNMKIVIGGGYINTELRSLSDSRVFEFTDYITLDDGEAPLQHLLEYWEGRREKKDLKRTFLLENEAVVYFNGSTQSDIGQRDVGTPDYSDLPLKKYLSVIETANPMHRLWSDGRWNKLTLAHGCYWGRCTFCDTSLDYIQRFEPSSAKQICDRMEEMIHQTGETGFHFVDEAAPPSLLKSLALEIIRRGLNVSWWTNIRFEKSFTKDLCILLKDAGCIAVSGGLEVASDRLLSLINKGVSVSQVAKVCDYFTQAKIMVHAYLMYGFPTQSHQETIDSLEIVRQLFEAGIVQSGFWHHFAMTAHSPVGMNPERFNIKSAQTQAGSFANNDLQILDQEGIDHAKYSEGLRKSLYNYMHDIGFDLNLQEWFEFKIKPTTIPSIFIQNVIESQTFYLPSPSSKVIWLGKSPKVRTAIKRKKNKHFENTILTIHLKSKTLELVFEKQEGLWLAEKLDALQIHCSPDYTLKTLQTDFEEKTPGDFILFWNSKNLMKLRDSGLLVL